MNASLVAVIRRIPGGGFAKCPRTVGMPAFPHFASPSLTATYFSDWPKRKSKFLIYGGNCRGVMGGSLATDSPTLQHDGCVEGNPDGGSSNGFSLDCLSSQRGGSCQQTAEAGAAPTHLYGGGGSSSVTKEFGGSDAIQPKAISLSALTKRVRLGQKLAMVTAYDYPSAHFARCAGIELVLVGDSLGNCRLGLQGTVGVTMEDMCRATAAVRRGVEAFVASSAGNGSPQSPKPMVIGDLPFGSYLVEVDALKNAAALRMAGADLVKLEGGATLAPMVKSLTAAGVGVMAHIGLEPQRALLQGGLKLQGTDAEGALRIVLDAKALAAAGAVAVVVECVPAEVGRAVQAAVGNLPVIGIGAGGDVAGQVLVCDDMLGMHGLPPSFAKRYADFATATTTAYSAYVSEVRTGSFPAAVHVRHMKPKELDKFQELLLQVGVDFFKQVQRPAFTEMAVAETTATLAADTTDKMQNPVALSRARDVSGSSPLPSSSRAHPVTKFVSGCGPSRVRARALSHGPALRCAQDADHGRNDDVTVLRTRAECRQWRSTVGRVALVPTMGSLHEGHLALIDMAKKLADTVIVSIFVNPTQFAAHEDLDKYPRNLDGDLALLRARGGVAAALCPSANEMYPRGLPSGTVVIPHFVKDKSEDAARPHFFQAVATVCLKLFNLVDPNVVVFGQKDAMQCSVIAGMLNDLLLADKIQLVIAPTSREHDGLAKSSRNAYLTPSMRSKAPAIYAALKQATTAPLATPESVRACVRSELEQVGLEVEYVSVAEPQNMEEKEGASPLGDSVVSVACSLDEEGVRCRLIDNIVVPATMLAVAPAA